MCPRRSFFGLLLGVVLILTGSVGAVAQAQSASEAASLDRELERIDSLRQTGAFERVLARLDSLQVSPDQRDEVLWRRSLTHVDLAKTVDEDERGPYYQRAAEDANAALRIDSTNAQAHLAKAVAEGRIALDAGTRERVRRSRAVKRHADRAIELDSSLASAYHVRGRWHREVDDLGFFERALLKTVYGGLPEASFEHAVRDFQQAIALEDRAFHHLELAKTYLKMDRPEEARTELRVALDLSSQDPFTERYKAEARELLSDLE